MMRWVCALTLGERSVVIAMPLRRSPGRERRLRERVARMLWVLIHTIRDSEES